MDDQEMQLKVKRGNVANIAVLPVWLPAVYANEFSLFLIFLCKHYNFAS